MLAFCSTNVKANRNTLVAKERSLIPSFSEHKTGTTLMTQGLKVWVQIYLDMSTSGHFGLLGGLRRKGVFPMLYWDGKNTSL